MDFDIKVSSDSRTIKKGQYFVPIEGETFDGEKFIPEALKKGAKGIIPEKKLYELAKKKLPEITPWLIE